MPTLDAAPFLDIFDPGVDADPDSYFSKLRAETAVARTPIGAVVLRRDPIQAVLSDPRFVSSIPHLIRLQGGDTGRLAEIVTSSVISVDGADHTRLRRLVSRSFTPRAAAQHRPAMRELVSSLVAGFAGAGECEFVRDFADHYPVQVICTVLGVPREDYPRFARWGDALTFALSLELSAHLQEVEAAAEGLGAYVTALVADRRTNPREDLVTSLVQATEDGDRLNELELLSMIAGLLFAGYDTTRNQLGHAMVLFCQHPDQWAMLAADPSLAANAVDEVMRLAGAVSGVPRVALENVEIDGWLIPEGTILFVAVASGNREEQSGGDLFDITADRPNHLSFGGGPHYCLGANLARAEMEEALIVLSSELTDLRLNGEPVWRTGTGISGPSTLPLAFRRR